MTVRNYVKSSGSGGKFIVLANRSDPDDGVIVFSDFTLDFQHHDILMRWQQTNKTTPEASGLSVAGGGWWTLENGMLILYGQSAAYGRFDPAWVRERLAPGMFLTETRIDVR
jgi:hypothetical protein